MKIPEHHRQTVIPHILVADAAEAIAFYTAAFGATELFRLPGPNGTIPHAELRIQGSTVMLGDTETPPTDPTTPPRVLLHVYVPDVDTLTAQATTAGGELVHPPTDMPYGARQSTVRDPFGHLWYLLTPTTHGTDAPHPAE
ncbi:glyoxalase [Kitasatospora sp. MMS16-BH015]|uniref:VOC family protein n=1 Tax=Kitasatospora sp. MMS16-BH015 TaxID=2018025 RepID=UPI000CA0B125|nr:VOC family protein [Kitasatospora sp. MMS16-BH015]AUG76450.1 glyoxalase [Kitasatospora sp. MMS16-BH015]